MLWIPPGFAHGFLALTSSVDFMYKSTERYAPEHERLIVWNDPSLAIDWPLPPGTSPLVSAKDARGSDFASAECFP
jgi:dTDP-4-dehydrorhamnose 3,5-epimerase